MVVWEQLEWDYIVYSLRGHRHRLVTYQELPRQSEAAQPEVEHPVV